MSHYLPNGSDPENSTKRDYALVTQEARTAYVKWFLNTLLDMQLGQRAEKELGTLYEGPRTITEVLQRAGPGGLLPNVVTVWRWLQEPWAEPLRAQLKTDLEIVVQVESDADWVDIVRNVRNIARTGKGRDAVLAAKFIHELRQQGEIADNSKLGQKISGLLNGRFDGTVEVRERVLRVSTTPLPQPPTITVASGS